MTLKEAQLIKRTAWRNMQAPTKPSEKDMKYVPIAVKMLTYVACLNYAMLDLGDDLEADGKMRHEVKRRYTMATEIVQAAHGRAYNMLNTLNEQAAREYNDRMDETYKKIQECVLLEGTERSYNIVVSLSRLIERMNREISPRYDFAPARPIRKIPGMLSCAGVKDYEIDTIIERNT